MLNLIKNIDIFIINFIYPLQVNFLNKIMIFFTRLGDAGIIWIAINIILLISKKYRKIGILTTLSMVICFLVVNLGLKPFVQRARPFEIIEELSLLIKAPKDFSFPSGHTAVSFVMICIFYNHIKKYFKIILLIGILISFSRLYLTVHFLSDILSGAVIGIFSVFLASKIYKIK